MNIRLLLPFLIFSIILCPGLSIGQEESVVDEIYLITIINKQEPYLGEIVKNEKDSLWIETIDETIGLSKQEISTIEPYNYNGRHIQLDRNVSRHVLAPTAISLRKGEIFYQNGLIIGNTFNFGITENFTLTAGAAIFLVIDDELDWFVMPKYSFKLGPKFHVSAGVVAGGLADIFDFDHYDFMFVPFANATFGGRDANFTVGFGRGINEDGRDGNITTGMLGANLRISEKLVFISENTFGNFERNTYWQGKIKSPIYLGAHAFRYIKHKNSLDFGVLVFDVGGDQIPLPYLGYARFF